MTGDGKIVVSGFYFFNNYQSVALVLSRLKVNGTPDSTFGVKSTRTSNYGGLRDYAFNVLIQPDGKPITAGNSDGKFGLLRLNTAGNIDATFNSTGKSLTAISSAVNAGIRYIQMEPDGKLMVAGYSYNTDSTGRFILARYHSGYNTSITEIENDNILKLYPNPVSSTCTLEYALVKEESVRISLYDMTGKLVFNFKYGLKAAGSYSETLNTEQLQTGVYILVLEHGSEKSTYKLIRE